MVLIHTLDTRGESSINLKNITEASAEAKNHVVLIHALDTRGELCVKWYYSRAEGARNFLRFIGNFLAKTAYIF